MNELLQFDAHIRACLSCRRFLMVRTDMGVSGVPKSGMEL